MKVRLKPPPPEEHRVVEADFNKPSTAPWSAEKLYSLSQPHRRVLVLELLAWGIAQAEQTERWRWPTRS